MDGARPTVVVVDDDDSVCRGLRRLLLSAGYEVLVFPSAAEFLDAAPRDRGSCLILDVRLPGMSGLELQQEMTRRGVRLPVIFITGHGDIPMSVQAMKAGALDFLPKPFDPDQLLACVAQAVRRFAEDRSLWGEIEAIRKSLDTLTPREREVLERIVTGMLNKEAAHDLGIAEKTIKVHRARVMEKMGVQSLAELVHLAEKVGIGLART